MLYYGDILYRYTLRNGKITVYEGEVTRYMGRYDRVCLSNGDNVLIPKSFGVIQHGVTIWLTKRDDDLARRMFIEHRESRLAKLLESIDNERKIIETLKAGL